MLQDDLRLTADPAGTLRTLRSIGGGIVRLSIPWAQLAPEPSSGVPPHGFNAGDPAAYPKANWARYDEIVRDARQDGIQLDFLLTGPAPLWATGAGAPPGVPAGIWKPSPPAFGQFARAVATRYSGRFTPAGAASPLPRVGFWEVWNEPNWGPSLAPQFPIRSTRILSAPEYRSLVDAEWSALQSTGHGRDTIVIGSLSPRGIPAPPGSALAAATQPSSPIGFTRLLYCADSSYRPLEGNAARQSGCPGRDGRIAPLPTTAPRPVQSDWVRNSPLSDQPAANRIGHGNPDTVEFPQIPNLMRALDRLQALYGSDRLLSVYNTEYEYITILRMSGTEYLSPATAAGYLNWAGVPDVARSTDRDNDAVPTLSTRSPDRAFTALVGFATGLIRYDGRPLPTFYSYRMPLFLPVTQTEHGRAPRGVGMRPPGAVRLPGHAPATVHPDPVPPDLERAVSDGHDNHARCRPKLLLRCAGEVPRQRRRPSAMAIPAGRLAAPRRRAGGPGDELQPERLGHDSVTSLSSAP